MRCSGPGLGSGVRAHVPQTFTVDSSKAGVAPLDVQLYGPSGNTTDPLLSCPVPHACPQWTDRFWCVSGVAEPISISDNGDGTHAVHYTPASDGPYSVCVKYADQEVPRRSVLRTSLPDQVLLQV